MGRTDPTRPVRFEKGIPKPSDGSQVSQQLDDGAKVPEIEGNPETPENCHLGA